MADEAKAKGNAAFSSGDFHSAILHFTEAVTLAPSNHVLYSNRSAAHASLHQYSEALKDAEKTVELKPDWVKGYSRLGAAYQGLGLYDEARKAYSKGLTIDPNNEPLKNAVADCESAAAAAKRREAPPQLGNPFSDVFKGTEMWAKLTADPSTRAYLQQPDFLKMMQDLQKNPSNMNLYLKDQRVMQALGVLLNLNMNSARPEREDEEGEAETAAKPPPQQKEREVEPEPEPEPMEIAEEEKEEKETKAQAQKEKEAGNAAYKKKDFETAIQHYTKAVELDDTDISFLTNRAAVYLEMARVSVEFFFFWLYGFDFLICFIAVWSSILIGYIRLIVKSILDEFEISKYVNV